MPHSVTRPAAAAETVDRVLGPATKVLSLDVFDTLVWRRVREPVDAFVLVGAELARRGWLAPHIGPELFAELRIRAERAARVAVEETTIEGIYEAFPSSALAGGARPAALVDVESQIERSILVPDLDVAALVRLARQAGKRVLLVSDTYWSGPQLGALVDHPCFGPTPFDRVLTSSEQGRNKGGGLFSVAVEEAGGDPAAVVHLGDNPQSDVECARRAGITAVHLPRRTNVLEAVLDREQAHRERVVDPDHGDFGLSALRAKVSASAPDDCDEPAYWTYGATVLGPVLAGFGQWVHRRTRELGADVVHCLMREGDFLARVVNESRGSSGAVRAETLWLSRQVVSGAALDDVTPDRLETFLQRQRPPTAGELLRTIGLDPSTDRLPFALPPLNARLTDRKVVGELFDGLSGSAELRGRILEHSAALRRRLVASLRKQLPDGASTAVLVDIGWGATIQANLVDVLELEGVDLRVAGLYLVTTERTVDHIARGMEIDGYLARAGEPAPAVAAIVRSPEVLEQVCMCGLGSMIDIDADLQPILAPINEPARQARQRQAAQDGVIAFVSEVERYRGEAPGGAPDLSNPAAAEQLLPVLSRALVAPTAEEAALFATWTHDENFGSSGRAPLVGDHVRAMVPYLDPVTLAALPMATLHWPFGLAALDDPQLSAAADAVALGRVPVEAVASELESGPVEIRFEGVGPGASVIQRHVARRNRRGLSFVRAVVGNEVVRRVSVHFATHPTLVRVDWLRLSLWRDGADDPIVHEVSRQSELDTLALVGAEWVAPRVLQVRRRGDALVLDVTGLAHGPVHLVELEVGFAALPIDDDLAARARRRQLKALAKRMLSEVEFRTGIPAGSIASRLAARLRG